MCEKHQISVSVIMPSYNAERFIEPAMKSILNQAYKDFEFIIIDDCSNDSTAKIVKEFWKKDKRIIYVKNERNMGVASSLNKGIHMAKGEFIARMDADDIAAPSRINYQVRYMKENSECVVCGTNIVLIDDQNRVIGRRVYFEKDKEIKKRLLQANPFAHPTTIIRKNILIKKNIFYTDDFPRAEDYHLWLRLADYGTFANLNMFLLKYRISDSTIKYRYCKEMLADTIRLKLKFGCNKKVSSCFTLLLEMFLFLLPRKVIIYLFRLKHIG
jgi:glycosyltransferase involved in cell wall biosynthesis